MNAKRILFIVLCVLLAAILALTGIALSKVGNLFGFFETPTPVETTTPSEAPTEPEATQHVHDYVLTDTIAAACDGYGWNIYTCQTCSHTHMPVSERTDPLGHDYQATTVTEATCTEAGFTELTCSRCGRKDTPADQQTEPLGHSFGHGLITEATCTEGGFTKFTCQRCGVEEIKDETEPLGHQFDSVVTSPATCTEDACTVSTCTRCAFEDKVIEVGSATGHTPGEWHMQAGEYAKHCSICAANLQERADAGKNYSILLQPHQTLTDENGVSYTQYSVTIGVSGDASVMIFTYTVNDYLGNDTLCFSYESGIGFIMEYVNQAGENVRLTIDHTAPLTITVYPDQFPTVE